MQTTQLLKRLGTTGCQKNKNKREPMTINLTGKDVTHKLNVDYLSNFTVYCIRNIQMYIVVYFLMHQK